MYTNPPKQKLQDTTSLSFRNLKWQFQAKRHFQITRNTERWQKSL